MALLTVRYVSLKAEPPPVRLSPAVEPPYVPARDVLPGSGSADLIVTSPCTECRAAVAQDFSPGPIFAGFDPPALVAREGSIDAPRVEVAPVRAQIPSFSGFSPLGKGY